MNPNKSSHAFFTMCKADYTSMVMGLFNAVYACHFRRESNNEKSYLCYPFIVRGKLNRQGDKFIIKRNDVNLMIFVELKEFLFTDYFSRINFYVYKTIPQTYKYNYIIDVHYNCFDECILYSSLIYDKQMNISDEDRNNEMLQRNFIYKGIEKSISDNEMSKIIIINELINCNIDLLWAVLLNMKIIHKYTRLLADKIDYKGNIIKQDMIIQLMKRSKSNNIKYDAVVAKCFLFLKEADIDITINRKNILNDYFLVNRFLFKINEYDNKCTIHVFFFLNNKYTRNQRNNFEIKKEIELRLIKKTIEHYNENLGQKIDDNKSDDSNSNEIIVFEKDEK